MSKAYVYDSLVNNILPNLITSIVLITLSVLLIIEFKKFTDKKIRIQNQLSLNDQTNRSQHLENYKRDQQIRKKEISFTRMTLILSLIYTLMRLLNLAAMTGSYVNLFLGLFYNPVVTYLQNFNFILIHFVQGINFFILVIWNKTFRTAFKNSFRCIKIQRN